MAALRTGLVFCIVLLGTVMLGHSGVFAQVDDNQKNPLITPKHAGSADKVAVIGLVDASNDDGGQEDAIINVIKGWINWVLGILGLIALIVLMYGGFLMVIASGNEDQYNKGFTILKQAAVGLIIIGVAWFIVSIVFRLVSKGATGVEGADSDL